MDGSTSEVKSYRKIVISNPVLQSLRKWTSVLQLQLKFNNRTVITLPFRKLLIWTQSSLADLISESDIPMGANLASPKPLSSHFWAEKLTGLRDEQFISTASTATTKVDTKNTQQWLYKARTLPACKKSVNDTSQYWGSSLTMEWFRQDSIKNDSLCLQVSLSNNCWYCGGFYLPSSIAQVDMRASCMVFSTALSDVSSHI